MIMSFNDLVQNMDAACIEALGEFAIYNGRKISLIVDKDVAQMGAFDTRGPARRHEASLQVCEVPDPKRGQIIETNDGAFVIDGVISNDGNIVRVFLNES